MCIAVICLMMLAGGGGRALARVVDRYDVEVVQTNADLSQRLTRLPDLEFGSAAVGREQVINVGSARHARGAKGAA
jgi:hypothetical protein